MIFSFPIYKYYFLLLLFISNVSITIHNIKQFNFWIIMRKMSLDKKLNSLDIKIKNKYQKVEILVRENNLHLFKFFVFTSFLNYWDFSLWLLFLDLKFWSSFLLFLRWGCFPTFFKDTPFGTEEQLVLSPVEWFHVGNW